MKAMSKSVVVFLVYLLMCIFFIVYTYIIGAYDVIILKFLTVSIIAVFVIIKIIEKEHKKELENIFSTLNNFEYCILKNQVNMYDETQIAKYYFKLYNLLSFLKVQAERNEKEKEELQKIVATISHQAKNSLSIVTNYYELKNNQYMNENDLIIKSEIEKMDFLFNNLIKIARVEVSDILLKEEVVDINYICLKLIKDVYKLAKDKNIIIKFDNADNYEIIADINWTLEALYNVVHNSIKYSNDNSIIEIIVTKYHSFVSIKIKDYGMGIENVDIRNIFKKFYRGRNSYEFEGFGVGLYLSQEIINRQGGFIKVESKIGEFTSFEIFFKSLNK